MPRLSGIPTALDPQDIFRKAHVAPGGEDAEDLHALLRQAQSVARPKALYREAYIESKAAETVTIAGVTFTSRVLRANLDKAERVFAFVATCGRELDAIPLRPGDVMQQFWLDVIKATVLGCACKHLGEHLDRKYALGRTATMSPGSGDTSVWPIEQQRPLFALLGDVEGQVGVRLTDSFLMAPNKTISGIRFPTETNYKACQVCHRQQCPSRGAPYDPTLAKTLGHVLDEDEPA